MASAPPVATASELSIDDVLPTRDVHTVFQPIVERRAHAVRERRAEDARAHSTTRLLAGFRLNVRRRQGDRASSDTA